MCDNNRYDNMPNAAEMSMRNTQNMSADVATMALVRY